MNTKFKKTKLPNGLRVVTESVPGRASVHVGVHILWGSRNEPEHMSGAAHLIEHMVFKGTQKRSSYDIVRDIEAVGAEINASTGKESTAYTVQCLPHDMELAVDVLSDITFNAKFEPEEFEKEKSVVLSEIEMSDENFEESVFDFAFLEFFKGSKLSKPILGTKKTVSEMNKEELFSLYKSSYQSFPMVLSVSGDVDHDQVVKYANKYFSNNYRLLEENIKEKDQAEFQSGVKALKKKSEQAHILINFKAPAFTESSRYHAYILNLALGGGMTSILYQKVREEKGLAYTVYSYLQSFLFEGVLSIYVGTKSDKAMEVIGLVISEISFLVENGMSEEQLNLYKKQLLGEVIMGQDDLESRMNSIALNELIFEKYLSPESVAKEIESISIEDINKYIKKYLDSEPFVLTLGPGKGV